MTATANNPASPAPIPATRAGLRRAAKWLRAISLPILVLAFASSGVALGIALRAIVALHTGRFTGGNDEIHGLDLVGVAISAAGFLLVPLAWVAVFVAYLDQRDGKVVSAINDDRWSTCVQWARRSHFMLAVVAIPLFWLAPLFLVLWLLRVGRVARLISELTADQKLCRICAELRRSGWVLVAEAAGLPAIAAVLAAKGLDSRFIGGIAALLLGMGAYVCVGLYRAVCRASEVLEGLARAERGRHA